MLPAVVSPRLLTRNKPIVDMAPVLRRDICRLNAERFYGVNRQKYTLYFWPAAHPQQNFSAVAESTPVCALPIW